MLIFFELDFILYQAPHSQTFSPACGAVVFCKRIKQHWGKGDNAQLTDGLVLYATFNVISFISQRRLRFSCISCVLPVLG